MADVDAQHNTMAPTRTDYAEHALSLCLAWHQHRLSMLSMDYVFAEHNNTNGVHRALRLMLFSMATYTNMKHAVRGK